MECANQQSGVRIANILTTSDTMAFVESISFPRALKSSEELDRIRARVRKGTYRVKGNRISEMLLKTHLLDQIV